MAFRDFLANAQSSGGISSVPPQQPAVSEAPAAPMNVGGYDIIHPGLFRSTTNLLEPALRKLGYTGDVSNSSDWLAQHGYQIGTTFSKDGGQDTRNVAILKDGKPVDTASRTWTPSNFWQENLKGAAGIGAFLAGGAGLDALLAGGVGGLGAGAGSMLPAEVAPISVSPAELAGAGFAGTSPGAVAASGIGALGGGAGSMLPAMTAPISVAPSELAGLGFAGTSPAQVAAGGIGSLPNIGVAGALPGADYSHEGAHYGAGGLDPVTNSPVNVGAGSGLGSSLSNLGSSFKDWALKNPQQAIQLAGLLGGKLFGGGGQGSDTAGGAGSGGAGSQADLTKNMPAAYSRQYVAPPAGYRPGISGEHIYFKKTGG